MICIDPPPIHRHGFSLLKTLLYLFSAPVECLCRSPHMLTPLFQSTFHHRIPFVVLEAPILRCWSVGSPVPMLPGKTLLQSMRRHIRIEKDPTTKRRECLGWCPGFATESKRRVSRMSRKCSCVALKLGSVTFGTPHLEFRNTCKIFAWWSEHDIHFLWGTIRKPDSTKIWASVRSESPEHQAIKKS